MGLELLKWITNWIRGIETIWSRVVKKCLLFVIFLVNKLAGFIAPTICCTLIKSDDIFSRTTFFCIWRWQSPLVAKELIHHMQVLLSLNMVTGVVKNKCSKYKSIIVWEFFEVLSCTHRLHIFQLSHCCVQWLTSV